MHCIFDENYKRDKRLQKKRCCGVIAVSKSLIWENVSMFSPFFFFFFHVNHDPALPARRKQTLKSFRLIVHKHGDFFLWNLFFFASQ